MHTTRRSAQATLPSLLVLALLAAACAGATSPASPPEAVPAAHATALPAHASPVPAHASAIPTDSALPAVTPSGAVNTTGEAFYVATDGNDGNPGTLEAPWRTIQHAADTMGPGNTVFVRGGTYTENVILTRSGAPGAPVTFAASPGETVILDGTRELSSAFESQFAEPDPRVSDIAIGGFTIQNYLSFGIVFWSVNDRVTLADLVIQRNGGEGIRFSNSDGSRVQNVLLQNNEGGFDCTPILPGDGSDTGCTDLYLGDVRAIDNGTQGDTGTDAFAVERGADILVERSLASGGVGDGFDFKSDRTTLSQVVAYNTRNNIKMWGAGSLLVNALAYDARADGNLVLVAGGDYTVMNVTVANMTGTAYLAVFGDTSNSGPTPIRVFNSIFYNDNPAMEGTLLWFGPDAQLAASGNNLYFNPYRIDAIVCADFAPFAGQCFSDADLNAGTWPEPNARYIDPGFLDADRKDFRLGPGSPAINAGRAEGAPTNDVDGRPRDASPDVGAFEYGG